MAALIGGMLLVALLGGGASAAGIASALQLNGSTQYVTFGAAPGLGATQFTLETWFKRTGAGAATSTGSLTSVIPLVTKGRGEADAPANVNLNYFLGIDSTTGKLQADFEDTSGGVNHPVTGGTVVTQNVWHHAAVTFNGAALTLYLDGAPDGTIATTATPESSSIQHAALGTAMNSTGVAQGFFQGIMDEARIWNVARTQTQIQGSKDTELTSATGLVGRWGLNEGAGPTMGDSTGNLNNGTAVAAPTWSSDVPTLTAAPPWNAGVYMNGASSFVTFGAAPGLGAAQFTLETWFKRTGAGVGTSTGSGGVASAVPLITKGRAEAEGSNVDMNYFLGIDATSGKLVADFEEGSGGTGPLGLNHPISGNAVVTSNVWHHVAATYDGTWKLYLDGALDASLVVNQPPRSDSIQHAALGTAMTSTGVAAGFFQGVIDEARIWNVSRTQTQIQASKDVAIPSATGLIGRWGLNEGAGTAAATSTGAANGSIVNAGWVAGAPVAADTTPPAQPQGLNALPGDGSISLSWTPNSDSDLAGYNLYRATTTPVPTSGTPVNGSTLLTSAAYIDTGLSNGTTYHYVVTAIDNVGNASTASAEAVATPAPSGPHALEFNGSTQYVTMGSASSLGAAQFTLETWFKRTGAGIGTSTGTGGIANAVPLITKGRAEAEGSSVDMNYFLGIDAGSGKLVADFEEGPGGTGPLGNNHPITGNAVVTSNVWHHVAATYDGTWKLYLDGVLDVSLAVNQPPRSDSTQHAALGTAMNSTGLAAGFFAGDLDEARIWNYARTGAQIRAMRDTTISSASGLLGRFGMDEGFGTGVANSAGSPNGTAVGGPTWIPGYGFTHDGTAPALPAGFAATPSDGSALLSWSANTETDLAGYNLYRSTTTPVDTSGTPRNGSDLIQGTNYSDGGLTNGTLYHYALVAVDGADNRSALSETTVTPQPAPGHALELSGTSQYVTMGSASSLGAAQFTLETWFKRTGTGVGTTTGALTNAVPLVTKGRGEADTPANVNMNYFLGIDASSGKLQADFEDTAGGANHPLTGGTVITNNVWHHAAVTFNGTKLIVYLDGVVDGTLATTAMPESTSIQHAALGTAMNSGGVAAGFFAGDLDEARIWNTARTGAQIRASKNSEISSANGLLARFGMNESSGTTVSNSAGPANGTTVGAPSWIAGYGFPQDALAPAAPANLVATADDGSAALSWDANAESDLAGYQLYRSTSSPVGTAGSPVKGSDLIQGTTYRDTGLTNGTTYYYALVAVDSADNASSPSAEASATPVQGDPTLAGAGDIATCTGTGDEETADVLDTMPGAGVFTLGDNVYQNGLATEFASCYGPSWGRTSIKSRTRPTIGNHDYGNGNNTGGGYFDYFNGAGNFTGAAGDRDKGYYSYDVGQNWHVVVVNSECYYPAIAVCDTAAQLQWLRADLAASSSKNVIAMWHRPRWSSGPSRPGLTTLQPLWQTLYDYGVELLLVGHDHHYERFAQQNASGAIDTAHGVREIIVGTGGAEFSTVGAAVPNSQVSNGSTNGVLKLTLHASSFDWRFVPAGTGTFTDSGTDSVHAAPANTPPTATVSLSSNTPKTNDTLTATATKADSDAQAVSLTYVWKVNGIVKRTFTSSSALTDAFSLGLTGNGDKGEAVSVEVTPNDGVVDGTPATAQATVSNTSPTFSQNLQDQTDPEGGAVSLSAAATDADADAIAYGATGLPPGLAIDASSGLISGTVSSTGSGLYTVDVTATDGAATVHDTFSWTITHPNRAPSVASVSIDQPAPKTNDTLTVTVAANDPDGDALTYAYQWTKNGTDLMGKTSATLNLGTVGNGDRGDVVAVRVTANDGYATSDPATSTGVTVQNSAPTVSVQLDNASPGTDDTLVATATSADPDGDGVSVTYIWKVNGVTKQTATSSAGSDSFDLSVAGNGDIGDTVSVDATPSDGTTSGTPSTAAATVVGAPAGSAVQLDGTNDYVTFGPASGLGAAQFTLETWFKRTGPGVGTNTGNGGIASAIPLVTKGRAEAEGSSVDMNYFLGIDAATGRLVADFEDMASGANHPITGSTVVTSNVWHHAAATYDGTTWRLYLDGAADGSVAVGQAPRSDSVQHAALGTAMNSTGVADGFFKGVLDEARIWNHARSQVQIDATKDYEVRTVPGLIGHWAMDAGSGGLLADSSGRGVDGALTNGPDWVAGFPATPDTIAPAAPQGLSATAGDGNVSLIWTASASADLAGYDVYRSATSPVSTDGAPLNSTLLSAPSYMDSSTTNGATYYYVVRAVDAADNDSQPSSEANATPQRASHALSFDGTNEYVTFGPAPQLGAATFTLETWFKRAGAGVGTNTGSGGIASAIPLVTKGRAEAEGSSVDMNYFLGIDASSGTLVGDFEDAATGANHPVSGQTTVTQNVWHHAAATFDGSYWRLYLDGALDAKLAVAATPRADSVQHAALATAMNSTGVAAGFFAGQLDEARIWNVARSGAQIRAARDSEITSSSNLVGRYGMNESSGTAVGNSAGLPNGTAVNGPAWVAGYAFPQDTTAPTRPLGLTATPDDQSLTLTWTRGTEVDLAGYDLYRSTSTPVDTSGTPVNGADLITGSSYADSGLTNGTAYHYALVAVDGSNNRSVASAEAMATPAPGDPVLIGAGDIAKCTSPGDEATADLVGAAPNAGVFTLGDNVYENGLASEFASCYTPSWGRPGIKARTRPVIGNHDYGNNSNDGGGYFDYFNGSGNASGPAGDRTKGYYSYDVGDYWHVVALNSECYYYTNRCNASDEEAWLKADLAANVDRNVIAMWHRPRWSSGASSPGLTTLQPLWQILYDYGVELSLAGHDHHYERFAPQNATGGLDNAHGVREIIVGTGGAEFTSVGAAVTNSEVRNAVTFGVLKLRLHQSSYDWQFIPAGTGTFTDSGTGTAHGRPALAPVVDSVVINQATPKTADTLSVAVTSHDPNNDPVTYTYQWQRNGVDVAGATGATLNLATAGNGDKNDAISVRVTASDGALSSAPVTSASVTIVNSPPTATAALSPASPGTNQTLTATATRADADGDTVTLTYVWKVNGVAKRTQQTTALTDTFDLSQAGNGDGGDVITVEITPSDGTDAGLPATASVTIDNTPPAAPSGLGATLTSTSVKLDWANNTEPDLAGYSVYRASAEAGPYTKISLSTLTVSEYVDNSAPAATTSYYQVTALDAKGNESPSAGVAAVRRISFRAASTAQNNATANIAITKPADVQPGDVLVAAIGVMNAPAITPPSGWTQVVNTASGTTLRQAAFWHVVSASDPASYSWTFASAQGAVGVISAYVGVDTSTPVAVSSGQANASSTSITAPSVSPGVTDTLLIGVFGLPTNSTIAPPGSMLEQAESATSGKQKLDVALADELRAGTGSTETRVATAAKASANIGQLIALRPLGAAPPPPAAPDAPTGLAASAGSNVVHLTWAAPANNGGSAVTAYRVYRGTTAGGETTPFITETTATSYDDTTALNGTTYYYKVSAVNDIGEGQRSNEASARPAAGATAPGAPTLTSATGTAGGIDLAWTAPASNGGSAITGYKVYRGTATGSYGTPTTLGNVTSYRDTSAVPGTQYFYVVAAVNAVGEGPKSNERPATAQAGTVPTEPRNLTAQAAKGKGVTLTWQAPMSNGGSAITGYRVYRGTTANGEGTTPITTTSGATLTFKDTTGTRGTTYYYVVTAVNATGESPRSNEVNATAR